MSTDRPVTLFVSGNGNISWADFHFHYAQHLLEILQRTPETRFVLGDFRGVDALTLELLKTATPHVQVYHVGDRPRYLPDKFRTHVGQWQILGGYKSDLERDNAAIDACTHYLAVDFNSDAQRKSGTQKNIDRCLMLGKLPWQPKL